jgi:hypothetical protein
MADAGLIRYRTIGPKRRLYSAASVLDLPTIRRLALEGAFCERGHGYIHYNHDARTKAPRWSRTMMSDLDLELMPPSKAKRSKRKPTAPPTVDASSMAADGNGLLR